MYFDFHALLVDRRPHTEIHNSALKKTPPSLFLILKPVLCMTLQCLKLCGDIRNVCCEGKHTLPILWNIAVLGVRTYVHASDWLVWISAWWCCHVTVLQAHLTMHYHTIFNSPCRFDHSMLGLNVKYIYQHVGGTQLIVGSHQSKLFKSTGL